MAIQFNSIQDPYGLQQGGSALLQTLLLNDEKNNLLQRENRQTSRFDAQQSALAQALGSMQGDINNPAVQSQFLQSLGTSGGDINQGLKYLQMINENEINKSRFNPANQPQKVSDIRKQLNKDIVNTVINSSKIGSTAGNLGRLRELSQELQGPTGLAQGLYGSEAATEFDALGLTTLDAPLKIFNPVGAIPIAKVKLLEKKFAPKATDLQSTIDGKLNALERLNKSAQEKVERLNSLAEKYGSFEAIPDQELLNYSNDSEKEIDRLISEPFSSKGISSPAETNFDSLPNVKTYSGKVVVDTDTGKRYKSNGTKWTLLR